MDLQVAWKECFTNWPEDLPRRGVIVTTFDEQIRFSSFMLGESLLLIERQTPDEVGTRQVFLPYQNVVAVKIIDIVKERYFRELGFEGKLSGK